MIILAAGSSSRLGTPKQLLPHAGDTMLGRAIALALSLEIGPVWVVLGAFAEEIRMSIAGYRVNLVENAEWETGMGGSLRVGAAAAIRHRPGLAALLVLVCDQPLIRRESLLGLLEAFRGNSADVIAASYSDTVGVPAIFGAVTFSELLQLEGHAGARHIIRGRVDRVVSVPMNEASIDIDTPQDLVSSAGLRASRS